MEGGRGVGLPPPLGVKSGGGGACCLLYISFAPPFFPLFSSRVSLPSLLSPLSLTTFNFIHSLIPAAPDPPARWRPPPSLPPAASIIHDLPHLHPIPFFLWACFFLGMVGFNRLIVSTLPDPLFFPHDMEK